MTSVPGRFSRFAHLLSVAIALATTLVTVEARAMTFAPMCDEVGASVVAPIPALPNATGELRATCDHEEETLRAAPPGGDRAAFERAFDPGQRAVGTFFTLAPPPLRTLAVAAPDDLPVASEHRESVYRPPRA